ncbi:MAG: HTH domain-containing protein [Clostridia bacterium]|nr:HTH domain-containing protein [Clostridia bacterium]
MHAVCKTAAQNSVKHSGRDNPPHFEIWLNYFLHMMELYSKKVFEISKEASEDELAGSLSYLNLKEKELLAFLLKNRIYEFTPIDISKRIGVSNKTIINRCAKLTTSGFLLPNIVKERIRSYSLTDFAKSNAALFIGL